MANVISQDNVEEPHTILLSTKFSPPSIRPLLVSRPRLSVCLNNALQHQLTLISASAGAGKSTLLSSWLASAQTFVPLWISLDASDNDPIRFWTALITSLQAKYPAFGQKALLALSTPQSHSSVDVVALLIQDMVLLSDQYVIVLDDYHVIETQAIHDAFAFLLEHLPTHIHFVVSTRTDPPLPLARLRVRDQLGELRTSDLCFTLDEANVFFSQVMALNLSSSDIATLVERTEGWIAGLQLAALSLRNSKDIQRFIATFAGSHSYIVDYVAEEVLRQQSEQVQYFLLATSLLERFTLSLCDSILEQRNSYRLLKHIEQSNLFVIVLDEQQQWYRYHHLFAEFLRAQLHTLYPERVNSIHTKAALWYVQNGYRTEAITHLLAASDFSLAAEHIEQYCDTLLKRGEFSTLLKWTAALPETLVRSHPRLCLYCAAALATTNQLDAAELRVLDAEHFLQKERQYNQTRLQGNLQNVENELITIRASLAGFRGDVQHTNELTQQALAQLATEDTFTQGILTASGAVAHATQGNVVAAQKMFSEAEVLGRAINHTHLWLASLCSQAYVVMEQGRFHASAEICRRVMAMEEHEQVTTSSMAYTVMGELHYQWNMLNSAEKFLQRGIEQGQEWGHMNLLARAALFLARTKRVLGDEDGARTVLRDLEQQALQHNIPQIVIYAHAMQAYFSLTSGDIEAAMHWAKGSGLSMHDSPDYLDEFVYLILIQIFSTADKMDGVMSLLERMLRRAQADGRNRNVIDILVTQALVYNKLGNIQQAQTALIQALSLAEPEGNVRAFIEMGEPIAQLLRDIMHRVEHEISPIFLQTLLVAIGSYRKECISIAEEHMPVQEDGEALTNRECEIVRLLAGGLSNQQIADTLVIAVSTVKWYLKQLSRKLNAHNRTQIVAYAQAKNLL